MPELPEQDSHMFMTSKCYESNKIMAFQCNSGLMASYNAIQVVEFNIQLIQHIIDHCVQL